MSTNGHTPQSEQYLTAAEDGGPQQIVPAPAPFSFRCEKVQGTQSDGRPVNLVRLLLFTHSGHTELFMPQDFAVHLADQLRTTAGGLTIATDLPEGLTP